MNIERIDGIPCKISGVYDSYLDLEDLHKEIKRMFELQRTTKLPKLKNMVNQIKKRLDESLFENERRSLTNKLADIEKEVERIQSRVDERTFISETNSILKKYQALGPKKKVISFGKKEKSAQIEDKDRDDMNKKLMLIDFYIQTCKKYIEMDFIRENKGNDKQKLTCYGCQKELDGNLIDENLISCDFCGTQRHCFYPNTSQIELSKSVSSKEDYEDRENFQKAILHYQGKQNTVIPDSLYRHLDEYFTSLSLPTGSVVRSLPLNAHGRKDNTSRDMMYRALQDTNNAAFYEDINLICHLYWGWTLPDITHLEAQLIKDYDMTQEVYKQINKNRKSSLNAQYRLYKHLQALNYPCNIGDFKIVKTPDILEYHDKLTSIMFEKCRLDFKSTL